MSRKPLVLMWCGLSLIALGIFIAVQLARSPLKTGTHKQSVQVWLPDSPTDADPIKYDSYVHHIAFRSVLGSLVSAYKIGEYSGQISDRWIPSNDHKEWYFHIRPGLSFDDGTPITPETVIRSWKRIALLLKTRGSRNDFIENIQGIENLTSLDTPIPGLAAIGEGLTIRLHRSQGNLLDVLSFGLFSIINPKDYDPVNYAWRDPRQVSSGNAYRITHWDSTSLELELRPELFPGQHHPKPLKKIKLVWDPESRDSSDLIAGDSNDASLGANYKFLGSAPSSVVFGRCFSWKRREGPCGTPERRKRIRHLIYESLERAGISPTLSFFPLGMPGITPIAQDFDPELGAKPKISGGMPPLRVFYRRKSGNRLLDAIYGFLPEVGKSEGIEIRESPLGFDHYLEHMNPDLEHYDADFGIALTGILISDPLADIRFMFLGKEGLRLPDSDGRILRELEQAHPSAQRINELLWEQSLIFPIGHYSSGLWARDSIDLDQLNTVEPPTEFNWIGFKTE